MNTLGCRKIYDPPIIQTSRVVFIYLLLCCIIIRRQLNSYLCTARSAENSCEVYFFFSFSLFQQHQLFFFSFFVRTFKVNKNLILTAITVFLSRNVHSALFNKKNVFLKLSFNYKKSNAKQIRVMINTRHMNQVNR